ncbi:unnamed protein product [Parnassius apollo]|uniref:(apollo) hypothetical protein n=1 Tax=Parnassius apollo TaxID=110799 RepID=A0A8S3Y6C5_PARAO|nr:unnamed protein product [Parnassius apollo]
MSATKTIMFVFGVDKYEFKQFSRCYVICRWYVICCWYVICRWYVICCWYVNCRKSYPEDYDAANNRKIWHGKKISNETKKKIDRDLLDLFIDSYQPFSLVEERVFKTFARWIPGYQLPSRKTISTVMLSALYNKTKSEMKMVLGPEC